MQGSSWPGARAALHFGERSEELNDARQRPPLIIVRRGVIPLQERHSDADNPSRLQHAIHLCDDEVWGTDVFKHGFGDNGIERVVFERQEVSIGDDIDFGACFDFKVNNVG